MAFMQEFVDEDIFPFELRQKFLIAIEHGFVAQNQELKNHILQFSYNNFYELIDCFNTAGNFQQSVEQINQKYIDFISELRPLLKAKADLEKLIISEKAAALAKATAGQADFPLV